jgi:SAM-dependent methyltransferase
MAVEALPLRPGLRVLEIGCGPGAALRLVAARVGPSGHVLGLDRSAAALAQAARGCAGLIAEGRVTLRCGRIEDFALLPGEAPFDLAFGLRVGVLDGRHPGSAALARVAAALRPGGGLWADGPDGRLRALGLPPG